MADTRLKIFFSGIGGSGLSAIAGFMKERGHDVSGSDRAFDSNSGHPLRRALEKMGITLHAHDGSGIHGSLDLVIKSTAVEEDMPEMVRSKALGLRIMDRPRYLAETASSYKTIAVTGTSGKSTVSGMLAFIMRRLGMDPNFLGGGRVRLLRGAPGIGNYLVGGSKSLVMEACESDGSILLYRPEHSIILNLELDHHPLEETAGMFHMMIRNTSGMVVTNADDAHLIKADIRGAVTFSVVKPSNCRAADVRIIKPLGTDFSLEGTRFSLSIPGMHNLYNALACIALLREMGIPTAEIAPALQEFDGLERRFDVLLNEEGRLVIDDYAHNPHKITALMQTVAGLAENVCYIFQPHGFAPTRMMKHGYIQAFSDNLRDSDHLMLLPIYYAGGTVAGVTAPPSPHGDISSLDLLEGIASRGKSVELLPERESLLKRLGQWKSYVVLGARDETLADFAGEIARGVASSTPPGSLNPVEKPYV
jgi:UDP-N-acetylmuramate--alanine ligase